MDLFVLGEIVKTRGLRGCVKVMSCIESQDYLSGLESVYIEDRLGKRNRYSLRKIDLSGKFLFLELDGISSVDAAQAIVGSKVLLPKDLLEDLPEGVYYWRDIIGLAVYSEEGNHLGCIESVFPTGANDVYVCQGGPREILLPAIADVILRIDLKERTMTVRLLQGL